jgi:hypothetical protein
MDKTQFARETGSEEIDLGQFIDDDDGDLEEEKENDAYDEFDTSTSLVQTTPIQQRSTILKENSMTKPSEIYSSSRSNISYTTKEKPSIDINFLCKIFSNNHMFIL